jgi:Tfp pilus assembly protein PilV
VNKRPFCHRRCDKGVTITEVVVAASLMLVSIVPILHALTVAQGTARTIEQKTRSLALAQAKLDEIRAAAWANYDQTFTASSVSLDGAYRCTVADTYVVLAVIRTITVSVGYDRDGSGTLSSGEILVTLKTQIARREGTG